MVIETQEYDVICVGFGPAALSIAVALNDSRSSLRVVFIEKQKSFTWHTGMLLPNTKMQISFLKDFATIRDPTSKFTFINYLGTFLPYREEYNDYMSWVAKAFEEDVRYGEEVVALEPVIGGPVNKIAVMSRSLSAGIAHRRITTNVIISTGGQAFIPKIFPSHRRISHSSEYNYTSLQSSNRIAVIGSGQSAAEVFQDLCMRYPSSEIFLIIRNAALKPSDDSPFVNEIFNPDRVDDLYKLPAEKRQARIQEDRATNYGVVRESLLNDIYSHLYKQKLPGHKEVNKILNLQQVKSVSVSDYSVSITLEHVDSLITTDLSLDHVFLATGYTRNFHQILLSSFEEFFEPGFPVTRDYRVKTKSTIDFGIWLQGCNESTHGLADSLLSIMAIRGMEIVGSIIKKQHV